MFVFVFVCVCGAKINCCPEQSLLNLTWCVPAQFLSASQNWLYSLITSLGTMRHLWSFDVTGRGTISWVPDTPDPAYPSHLCWSLSTGKFIPTGPLQPVCPFYLQCLDAAFWLNTAATASSAHTQPGRMERASSPRFWAYPETRWMSWTGTASFISFPERRNFCLDERRQEVKLVAYLAVRSKFSSKCYFSLI